MMNVQETNGIRDLTMTEIDEVIGGFKIISGPPSSIGIYVEVGGNWYGFHIGPNGFHGWIGDFGW